MRLVMKFGGKCLSADGIHRAANIVKRHAEKSDEVIVIVSALNGVTDSLLSAINLAKRDQNSVKRFVEELKSKHIELVESCVEEEDIKEEVLSEIEKTSSELQKVLTGISYLGECTPKSRDYVLSFGERLSTPIFSGALRDIGLKTKHLTGGEAGIVTDSNFGEAKPLVELTAYNLRKNLLPLLKEGIIPVVSGYIAVNQYGEVTTLGRGGSDYTATLIGASLEVDEVQLWTDVDGIMTADPKIVPSAKVLDEISYAEAIEMALFRAKRLHPRSLTPAKRGKIPVRIRNLFNLANPGTLITSRESIISPNIVKSVSLIKDVCMITVSGAEMIGTPGVAARIFDVLAKNGINIMMISQSISETNISFVVSKEDGEKAVEILEREFLGGFIDNITAEDDVCVIAAIGAGMKGTPGVAARIFEAVARRGINVRMIAQGSSELNISFIVKDADGEEAVRAIHDAFMLGRSE